MGSSVLLKCIFLVLGAAEVFGEHVQHAINRGDVPLRGVNLGSWLLVEYWMTAGTPLWENVPEDIGNKGEFQAMKHLGQEEGTTRFEQHRKTWITEEDIKEIAESNLNTVRVPVGYWMMEKDSFDSSNQEAWKTYAPGSAKYLDTLINDWAMKYNVAVLVGVHAAKGSQNGADHSAPPTPGTSYWGKYEENRQTTLEFVKWIEERYKGKSAFLGIGLLNEPDDSNSVNVLTDYYQKSHEAVRENGDSCALTFSPPISGQNAPTMDNSLPWPKYTNTWIEWHKYLIWGYGSFGEDRLMSDGISQIRREIQEWQGNWLFIGEWSVASPGDARFEDENKFKEYAKKYMEAVSLAQRGWTYWSWKCAGDEGPGRNPWSLRQMLRRKLMKIE